MDWNSVQFVVEVGVVQFGVLEGFVYCVGLIIIKLLYLILEDEFKQVFDVNFFLVWNVLCLFVQQVVCYRVYVSVVLIGLVVVIVGFLNYEVIVSVKVVVGVFVQLVVVMYVDCNICVNCIYLGLIMLVMLFCLISVLVVVE